MRRWAAVKTFDIACTSALPRLAERHLAEDDHEPASLIHHDCYPGDGYLIGLFVSSVYQLLTEIYTSSHDTALIS